jgi:hypothetical protein
MDQKEKALDKIRKLLALADNNAASEGEIENALKAAQNLMSKFDLDMSDVEVCEADLGWEDQDYNPKNNERKYWLWDLLEVIAKSQNCRSIKKKRVVNDKLQEYFRVFGTKMEVKVTTEIFKITVPIIRNISNKRYREKSNNVVDMQLAYGLPINPPNKGKFFNDYVDGFLYGLHLKLEENKEKNIQEDETGKYGLIIVKKTDLIKDFVQENTKNLKDVKTSRERDVDVHVWLKGVQDGKTEHEKMLE